MSDHTPLVTENTSTPKEIDQSQYAGVMKRGIAALIDVSLIVILYVPFFFYFSPVPLSLINDPTYKLEYLQFTKSLPVILAVQILSLLYFTMQYRSKHQATLGMRLVDIKLVNEDFKKPSLVSLILRYALYALPFLAVSVLQQIGLISLENSEINLWLSGITTTALILMIALTKRKQAYYDIAAKTLVLQEPKENNPPFVYAGLGRRILSYLLDLIIIIFLFVLTAYGLGVIAPPKESPSFFEMLLRPSIFIIALILPLAYSLLQYRSKHQATLGMRLLSIKIMTTDYQKPSIKQLFFRYCLDFFLFLFSLFNIIPAAMILFTDRKQAYYDKMSKVIFVKTSK